MVDGKAIFSLPPNVKIVEKNISISADNTVLTKQQWLQNEQGELEFHFKMAWYVLDEVKVPVLPFEMIMEDQIPY